MLFFANTDWYLYNFRRRLIDSAGEHFGTLACVSPPGPFGQKLFEEGFDWQPLPFRRQSKSAMLRSSLASRRFLSRLIDDFQPSIIHSFTLTSILLTWMASLGRDCVRINAVTGMGYAFTGQSFKHRLLRLGLRPLIRRALNSKDAWTVVQNPTDQATMLEQFKLDPARVRLIPGSGVDVDRFAPASRARSGSGLRVGLLARLLHDKGVGEFIEAARALHEQFPQVEFLIAGDPDPGNPAAIDQRTLARWRGLPNVEFTGHVDDVPSFLNSLDVFVLPSYREGLSRSLIEAGACGLPLVTTDVPGCRDVVDDGVQGRVVPARDGRALADAIRTLLEDEHLRQQMGRAARERVVREFSDETVNEATLALYREVLAERAARP
ncbi:glycosyltransferase family 4 protein [Wenzhouxiangella marina]|uniref:glycosyltransferase family 4 protein n=1 Tax=Wenzhouxiangella marina TaxID=1579979 RepID=UPI001FDEFF0C|nr:glycosyltransferase family 4 protein [Wenzhouxiangella marina]